MPDEEKMKFPKTAELGNENKSLGEQMQAPSSLNVPGQGGGTDLINSDVMRMLMSVNDPEQEAQIVADAGLAALMPQEGQGDPGDTEQSKEGPQPAAQTGPSTQQQNPYQSTIDRLQMDAPRLSGNIETINNPNEKNQVDAMTAADKKREEIYGSKFDDNKESYGAMALGSLIGGLSMAIPGLQFLYPAAIGLIRGGKQGVDSWHADKKEQFNAYLMGETGGQVEPEKQMGMFIDSAKEGYASFSGDWEAYRNFKLPQYQALPKSAQQMAPFDSVFPPSGPTTDMYKTEAERKDLMDSKLTTAKVREDGYQKYKLLADKAEKAGDLKSIEAQKSMGEITDKEELLSISRNEAPNIKSDILSSAVYTYGGEYADRWLAEKRGEDVLPFEDAETPEDKKEARRREIVSIDEKESKQYEFLQDFAGRSGPREELEPEAEAAAIGALEWRDVPGKEGMRQLALRRVIESDQPLTDMMVPGKIRAHAEYIAIVENMYPKKEATEELKKSIGKVLFHAKSRAAANIRLAKGGKKLVSDWELAWED